MSKTKMYYHHDLNNKRHSVYDSIGRYRWPTGGQILENKTIFHEKLIYWKEDTFLYILDNFYESPWMFDHRTLLMSKMEAKLCNWEKTVLAFCKFINQFYLWSRLILSTKRLKKHITFERWEGFEEQEKRPFCKSYIIFEKWCNFKWWWKRLC